MRDVLRAHGGTEVKTLGDGFVASFTSATKALECATALQRAFARHAENGGEPLSVRVGVYAGEPIAENETCSLIFDKRGNGSAKVIEDLRYATRSAAAAALPRCATATSPSPPA